MKMWRIAKSLLLLTSILLALQGGALALTNGDLRLTGIGSSRYAGRLEVYYNGRWGTVNGGGANPRDSIMGNFNSIAAQVACRQMGLGFAVEYYSFLRLPDQRFQYGRGTGPVHLSEVECFEGEEIGHLLQCTVGAIGPPSSPPQCREECGGECNHCYDVALQCSGDVPQYNGQIRLTPPPSATPLSNPQSLSSGVVELYSSGQWKGACLGGVVTPTVGNTLCRQLGYTGMDTSERGAESSNVWNMSAPLSCNAGRTDSDCISSCLTQLPTTAGNSCTTTVLHCQHLTGQAYFDNPPSTYGSRSTCSQPIQPPPHGTVNLDPEVEPRDHFRHRVDVYVGGAWGTICSRTFSVLEGDVICKQLGFPVLTYKADVTVSRDVSPGTGAVYDVNCTGLESHISECAITNTTLCTDHSTDVVIQCSPIISPYGSLSLQTPEEVVGGASGTLLLFDGNNFRPVCDAGFTQEQAEVACRQLGYTTGSAIHNSYFGLRQHENLVAAGLVQLTGSCSGSEPHLLSCDSTPISTSRGARVTGFTEVTEPSNQCRQGLDEVALQCVSSDVDVRLLPIGSSMGRLQVRFNGMEWGRVCGAGFGWNEALVACRNLGYESAIRVQNRSRLPEYVNRISNLSCFGVEQNMLHCNLSLSAVSCPDEDEDIWLECGSAPLSTDGDLRLVDGETTPTNMSGRLEISLNKKWMSVCGELFTAQAADVACRKLGFRMAANYCTDACFGEGTGGVYFAEDQCVGDEGSLLDCPHEQHHPRSCHHSSDVGLICVDPLPVPSPSTGGQVTTPTPKLASPFNYYIIAGVVGGVALLLVAVVTLVCCVCCYRHRRHKRQRTWTNQSVHHQNGGAVHSYHNGAVADMTSTTKEKEGGFDDPTDLLEAPTTATNTNATSTHDVILHVLNHAHLQEGDSPRASKKKKQKHKAATTTSSVGVANGFHGNSNSGGKNSVVVAMGNGVTVGNGSIRTGGNGSSESSYSPSSDIPMCPPPDYNHLFPSETTPTRQQPSHHGNGRVWYDSHAEDKV